MVLICWVSQAVRPTKMSTPAMEIIQPMVSEWTKMFTSEAMMRPKRHMMRMLPQRDRSLLVQ